MGALSVLLLILSRLSSTKLKQPKWMEWRIRIEWAIISKTVKTWGKWTKRWVETVRADLPTADKGKSGDSWKKKWRFYKKYVRLYRFLIKIKQTLFSLGGGGRVGDKYLLKYYLALFVVPVVTRCRFKKRTKLTCVARSTDKTLDKVSGTSIPHWISILFNKVTFHFISFYFRVIFHGKPWDCECCHEAVRNQLKRLTAESWELAGLRKRQRQAQLQ